MGPGWRRPDGCDVRSSSCRVNGYYKHGSSYQECSLTCLGHTSCAGFAISESTYRLSPNKCYVHGSFSQQNTPYGWVEHPNLNFDVHTSSNHSGVMCYKTGS